MAAASVYFDEAFELAAGAIELTAMVLLCISPFTVTYHSAY